MFQADDRPKGVVTLPLLVKDDANDDAGALLQASLDTHAIVLKTQTSYEELCLQIDRDGLALVQAGQTLRADFTRMIPRILPDRVHRELVVRASKSKTFKQNSQAIDATAGLGEDAFLLAAAGFSVRLYERNPLIAVLLRDALRRASCNYDLKPLVSRMQLVEGDSRAALLHCTSAPAVVLLDPMFPPRQKTALVKKKLQMLQQLEPPCIDERSLLDAAFAAMPHKVVIKRSAKGPYLAGKKPDYSLKGKAVRYDCFVLSAR